MKKILKGRVQSKAIGRMRLENDRSEINLLWSAPRREIAMHAKHFRRLRAAFEPLLLDRNLHPV